MSQLRPAGQGKGHTAVFTTEITEGTEDDLNTIDTFSLCSEISVVKPGVAGLVVSERKALASEPQRDMIV